MSNEYEVNKTYDRGALCRLPLFDMITITSEVDMFLNNVILKYCEQNRTIDKIIVTLDALEQTAREKRLLFELRSREMSEEEEEEVAEAIENLEKKMEEGVPKGFREPNILVGGIKNDNNTPKGKQGVSKNGRRNQKE